MIRIAKMADEDGGTDGGADAGALETGADGDAESGTEGNESLRGRGGGGSLRGRGGTAIGRAALALVASASPVASAGSVGMRALLETFTSPASGIEGCERRRIGGG
jgi:hypothetical protein